MRTVASDEPVAIVPSTSPGEGRKSREAIPRGWAESRVKRWAPVLISHRRIDRSPEAEILESVIALGIRVNVHVIFREGYFVDCSSVSFCFAIPDSQKQFKGVDVEDLYCPV
jgi:hypothetical protein